MTAKMSYCRLCQASCGVVVDVAHDRVEAIRGDPDNLLSQGYTCAKGRRVDRMMNDPDRLTTSMTRTDPRAGHTPIAVDDAISQIAEKIRHVIDDHGPDSVAMFIGTQHHFATLTDPMARAWFKATGSHKLFSTMTIDQSAKWVTAKRMGEYTGGRQRLSSSDVWLMAGTNPLVSVNGGNGDGALMHNPSATLRAARQRGLRLIVIDPRRSETAYRADLHLQPKPGTDAVVFAGLLHIIFEDDLHDHEFCAKYVDGVDLLRHAVGSVTPAIVETICGVEPSQLIAAARMFAAGSRGMVSTGTGVCMGPHSNLAEHLATSINVVCGRYLRQGDNAEEPGALRHCPPARAAVSAPDRTWEVGYHSRFGAGHLYGQLPSGSLCDEILSPGSDRVRALIVSGGNPVLALPEQSRARQAMSRLDLLVTIDTRLSDTSQLAHYVIAPTMMYERADNTVAMERFFAEPFAMHTDPIVRPPGDVIEDWQFFYRLAQQQAYPLRIAATDIDMDHEPGSDQLLAMLTSRGRLDVAAVASAAHGIMAERVHRQVAAPAPDEAANRLQLLPGDVADELRAVLSDAPVSEEFPMRLVVRRVREAMNSVGPTVHGLPKVAYNPAYMCPEDMDALGITAGVAVTLSSPHGSVEAIAHRDPTLSKGVVSMTHGWGGMADGLMGVNVNDLTSSSQHRQTINFMPTLTALPIRVVATRLNVAGASDVV